MPQKSRSAKYDLLFLVQQWTKVTDACGFLIVISMSEQPQQKRSVWPWAQNTHSVCIERTDGLEDESGAPDYIPKGDFTLHELDSKNILQQLQGPQEDGEALACILDNNGIVRWTAKGVTDDMFARTHT